MGWGRRVGGWGSAKTLGQTSKLPEVWHLVQKDGKEISCYGSKLKLTEEGKALDL